MQALEKTFLQPLKNIESLFLPSKSRNFITDLYSSGLESTVALTPTLFNAQNLRVYIYR